MALEESRANVGATLIESSKATANALSGAFKSKKTGSRRTADQRIGDKLSNESKRLDIQIKENALYQTQDKTRKLIEENALDQNVKKLGQDLFFNIQSESEGQNILRAMDDPSYRTKTIEGAKGALLNEGQTITASTGGLHVSEFATSVPDKSWGFNYFNTGESLAGNFAFARPDGGALQNTPGDYFGVEGVIYKNTIPVFKSGLQKEFGEPITKTEKENAPKVEGANFTDAEAALLMRKLNAVKNHTGGKNVPLGLIDSDDDGKRMALLIAHYDDETNTIRIGLGTKGGNTGEVAYQSADEIALAFSNTLDVLDKTGFDSLIQSQRQGVADKIGKARGGAQRSLLAITSLSLSNPKNKELQYMADQAREIAVEKGLFTSENDFIDYFMNEFELGKTSTGGSGDPLAALLLDTRSAEVPADDPSAHRKPIMTAFLKELYHQHNALGGGDTRRAIQESPFTRTLTPTQQNALLNTGQIRGAELGGGLTQRLKNNENRWLPYNELDDFIVFASRNIGLMTEPTMKENINIQLKAYHEARRIGSAPEEPTEETTSPRQ